MFALQHAVVLLFLSCVTLSSANYKGNDNPFKIRSLDEILHGKADRGSSRERKQPCTCGVFLSSQVKAGSDQPQGEPLLLHEKEDASPCNPFGNKQCINRCLDQVVSYLPKSADILCAAAGGNVFRERAYLFIKNCEDRWINTKMSAGREICCRDSKPVRC